MLTVDFLQASIWHACDFWIFWSSTTDWACCTNSVAIKSDYFEDAGAGWQASKVEIWQSLGKHLPVMKKKVIFDWSLIPEVTLKWHMSCSHGYDMSKMIPSKFASLYDFDPMKNSRVFSTRSLKRSTVGPSCFRIGPSEPESPEVPILHLSISPVPFWLFWKVGVGKKTTTHFLQMSNGRCSFI